jgi:hypothetical protein
MTVTKATKQQCTDFETILLKGKITEVGSFLSNLSSEERSGLASIALKIFRKTCKGKVVVNQNKIGWEFPLGYDVTYCSTVAVICTAEGSELLGLNWKTVPDECFEDALLKSLRPAGLSVLGDIILDKHPRHIHLLRKQFKDGLIPKPQSELYYQSLMGWRDHKLTLKELLLDNKDVLEEDLWHFFEIEGNGELSLAAVDKYSAPNQSWTEALCYLAQEGLIDRQKLLDASLSALGRGFAQFRATWHSSLHERLAPTVQERSARLAQYGALLANPVPTVASFALKAIEAIDKHSGLPIDFVQQNLPLAMTSQTKSNAVSAIAILQRAVKKDKAFALTAAEIVCEGLYNPAPEIQEKVLDFLEKNLTDTQLSTLKLERFCDSAAASTKGRLNKLINKQVPSSSSTQTPTTTATASADKTLPSAKEGASSQGSQDMPQSLTASIYQHQTDINNGWPLNLSASVAPILSPSQLIERASYCLENCNEVEEIENVLNGISSIDCRDNSEFAALAKPLTKRAKTIIDKKSYKSAAHGFFAAMLWSWLTDDIHHFVNLDPAKQTNETLSGINCWVSAFETLLYQRMLVILQRLSLGTYLPLPGSPTNRGGWLDATVFLSRCKTWRENKKTIEPIELVFVLMRIPETQRQTVATSSDCPEVLKLAIESIGAPDKNVLQKALQIFKTPEPLVVQIAREVTLLLAERKLWRDVIFESTQHLDVIRWQAISAQAMRESFFERAIQPALGQITYADVSVRALRGYFEVLCQSGAPLGVCAYELLTIGLFLSDPEISGLSVDALILAIDEKRLEIAKMSKQVIPLLFGEYGKHERLARSLKELARVSPLHRNAVSQLLQSVLRRRDEPAKHDIWAVLELLHELLMETQAKVTDLAAREYLETLNKGTSKTNKLATKLLAL